MYFILFKSFSYILLDNYDFYMQLQTNKRKVYYFKRKLKNFFIHSPVFSILLLVKIHFPWS